MLAKLIAILSGQKSMQEDGNMMGKKQNLKYLKRLIATVKRDLDGIEKTFRKAANPINFGTVYNLKVKQIGKALFEFKIALEKVMEGLDKEIDKLVNEKGRRK